MSDEFTVKDSGERAQFASGMVRDTSTGKARYTRVLAGPMFKRWAAHLEKGAAKYPDVAPGVANWTLAEGQAEQQRFMESAFTHFVQWLNGERDEDHAAAVFFNINGAEYARERALAAAAADVSMETGAVKICLPEPALTTSATPPVNVVHPDSRCRSKHPDGVAFCSLERRHETDHRGHIGHDLNAPIIAWWPR